MIRLRNIVNLLSRNQTIFYFCSTNNQPNQQDLPNQNNNNNPNSQKKGLFSSKGEGQFKGFQSKSNNRSPSEDNKQQKGQQKQYDRHQGRESQQKIKFERDPAKVISEQKDSTKSNPQNNKRILFDNKFQQTNTERNYQQERFNDRKQQQQYERRQLFGKQQIDDLKGTRKMNCFLKRQQQTQTTSELHLQDLINNAQRIQNDDERISKLIKIYGEAGQVEQIKSLFQKQTKFNSGIYGEYIIQLCNNGEDFQNIKEILLSIENNLHTLQSEVFQSVYINIFNLDLTNNEKAIELEFLINITKAHQLKVHYDLTFFIQLIDIQLLELDHYSQIDVIRVFNQYLNRYAHNQKNKQQQDLPDLHTLFEIAVYYTINFKTNDAQEMLDSFKVMQKISTQLVNETDLIRYLQFQTTKQNTFSNIIDQIKHVKNPNFIYELEIAIKQLDMQGIEIKCVTKQELETLYLSYNDKFQLRIAELICLFAERFEHYSLIADLFQKLKQNNQNEFSSFIYYKAIQTLIEVSGNKQIGNAVTTLLQEAQQLKVPVGKVHYYMSQIKAYIKEGQFKVAYDLFTQNVIQNLIITFQKEKIRRFLIKYIQKIKFGKFSLKTDKVALRKSYSQIEKFVQSLSDKQLLQFYEEDKSDNFLLESIIGQDDIFEYNKAQVMREIFQKIKKQVILNIYDYTQIIEPKTEDQKLEREVVDNYEYYVNLERQNLLRERKAQRISKIFSKLTGRTRRREGREGLMAQLYKSFTDKQLERGLMANDLTEFPEVEQVQQIQIKIKKAEQQIPHKNDNLLISEADILAESQQEQQETEQITIEQIPNEDLNKETNNSQQKNNEEKKLPKQYNKYDQIIEEVYSKLRRRRPRRLLPVAKRAFSLIQEIEEFEQELLKNPETRKKFIKSNYKLTLHEKNLVDYNILKRRKIKYRKAKQVRLLQRMTGKTSKPTVFMNPFVSLADFTEMKYIYYNIYTQYDRYIAIPPANYQQQIWDLIAWGIKHNEPMAIKLGEYYVNLCGAKMPEFLAKAVANFYKYQVGTLESNIRKKWTQSLEIINNIDTQKVYGHVQDPAFVTDDDLDFLHSIGCQQEYKGVVRSVLNTTLSYRKYVRYGISQRDLLL